MSERLGVHDDEVGGLGGVIVINLDLLDLGARLLEADQGLLHPFEHFRVGAHANAVVQPFDAYAKPGEVTAERSKEVRNRLVGAGGVGRRGSADGLQQQRAILGRTSHGPDCVQ